MKEILEIARNNVLRRREKEFQEEIDREYLKLLYESQKVQADDKTKVKLKQLYEKSRRIWARSFADAYPTHRQKSTIKEYFKTEIYHPKTLKEIEKWIEEYENIQRNQVNRR